jgi:ABC-type multidrug transport system ATPase subunit
VVTDAQAVSGLVVRRLCAQRSGHDVVLDASLDLAPGEIAAVVGPNGGGKTSLLEAIVGVLRARAGSVSWGGHVLTTFADRARTFAFAPDEVVPPRELRVRDVVAHARRTGGASDSLVATLLEQLAVEPLLDAIADELSRGEAKRVALFQALATTRPVIVLDEPFGAFDPRQLVRVLDVVRARARAGVAVLLTSHQLADAEKIADRVLLFSEGRIVAEGTASALKHAYGDASTLEEVFLRALGDGAGTENADARA